MNAAFAETQFDVLIVGAGVVGATMASLLLKLELCRPGKLALIADRFANVPGAAQDWDLRVFALSRASEQLLRSTDVFSALPKDRVCAYEKMCVWDGRGAIDGRGSLTFDCAEIGEPNLGFIVDGAALQRQCVQAARNAGALLIEGAVQAIEGVVQGSDVREPAAVARLADGRGLRAHLIVGADGTDSTVRRLLRIGTTGHSYDQDAIVAHVRTAKPHQNTAWQRFLPGGPLAFLPLSDGRSSIVWSVAHTRAANLSGLSAGEFNAAITAASDEVLGDCELTTARKSFALNLSHATSYVRPHAVLIGDAAHVVHPLAGQGLNLGLLDCAELASMFQESGGVAAYGDLKTLRRYERRRRSENLLAAAALDGLDRLFSNEDAISRLVRTAGVSLFGRAGVLKRSAARRALGMSGDVPRILKDGRVSQRR